MNFLPSLIDTFLKARATYGWNLLLILCSELCFSYSRPSETLKPERIALFVVASLYFKMGAVAGGKLPVECIP